MPAPSDSSKDSSKDSKHLEEKFFKDLKKNFGAQGFSYRKDTPPPTSPAGSDLRPTLDISPEELHKTLQEENSPSSLSSKASSSDISSEKLAKMLFKNPQETLDFPAPHKNAPAKSEELRPTMDISQDELKKALQEQAPRISLASAHKPNNLLAPRPTITLSPLPFEDSSAILDPRPTVKLPPPSFDESSYSKESRSPSKGSSSLNESELRPTMDISQDELKKALREQAPDLQAYRSSAKDPRPTLKMPPPPVVPRSDPRPTEKIDLPLSPRTLVLEEVPPSFKIYDFFLAKTPLTSGAQAYIFEAYRNEERTVKMGIIKLAKKGFEKQLLKEIEFAKAFIQGSFENPYVVQFLQTGMTPLGLPYIFSEKLEPFPRKDFTLEDAMAISCKIADVVAYLHKNHLYHRDIKPENILFARQGQTLIPKLFDFGTVSKQINESDNVACSPYFAAPEVLKKIRGFSQSEIQFSKADVFSLGMSLLGFLQFNPYLALDPQLEKKFSDPRTIADQLILFLDPQHYEAFWNIIERFIKSQEWNTSLLVRYGIKPTYRKDLIEEVLPLLQKILSPRPEERPLSSSLAKKLEEIFRKTCHFPSDKYFENGCSFLLQSPPPAPSVSPPPPPTIITTTISFYGNDLIYGSFPRPLCSTRYSRFSDFFSKRRKSHRTVSPRRRKKAF
jgi:serine/threonine protein kinase